LKELTSIYYIIYSKSEVLEEVRLDSLAGSL